MNFSALFFLILLFVSSNFSAQTLRIAFGSCGHQDTELGIYKVIAQSKPDYFVFLGDNIYGDTRNMEVLQSKYAQLSVNLNFRILQDSTQILATWDDHDYGENDAGRHYPMKEESKALFLNFFKEPNDSDRYKHKGVYTSYEFKIKQKKIQLLVLDTRTFRDNMTLFDSLVLKDSSLKYEIDYVPTLSIDSTFLGDAQWIWLENKLKEKADYRIIISSTQFGISYNGYESWSNFPHERNKLLQLILKTKANGLVFISGDVHYGELSKVNYPGLYPIYDLTASGLSESLHFATPNSNRIQGPVMENHFGLLTINTKKKELQLQVINHKKEIKIDHKIGLKVLKIKR